MRALLFRTCAMALAILPQAARCQIAVKGNGPVLIKVLPAYPYAALDQRLEGSGGSWMTQPLMHFDNGALDPARCLR